MLLDSLFISDDSDDDDSDSQSSTPLPLNEDWDSGTPACIVDFLIY